MLKKLSIYVSTLILIAGDINAAPICSWVFSSKKGAFDSREYKGSVLDDHIPVSAWEAPLTQRQQQFASMYPEHVKLVRDVHFKYANGTDPILDGTRDVLVISTQHAPAEIFQDYLNFISLGTISFPLAREGGHLHTRFGVKTYDNISVLDQKVYRLPESHRIETVMQLTPAEFKNLATYISLVRANHDEVIGKFNYLGSQKSKGQLDLNTCLVGGHNCTSWLATSGIGSKGERLLELMGGNMDLEVGTNPGWWSLFLNTQAPKDRIPFTVFWTPNSLQEALNKEVRSFEQIHSITKTRNGYTELTLTLPWDFKPH